VSPYKINVKSELSSVDVRVLVCELRERLVGARVDKAYQVGAKELVLKLFGRGTMDVVVAPNFMCVTRYRRPAPKKPSSFAMQLRKRLGGAFIRDVSQHGFDRIVEFYFDEFVLIFELFSRGNVILCAKDMKIIGLLEWQKWKDRTLGVGKPYEYPPLGLDPFAVGEKSFTETMSGSGRTVAAALATKMGLGGYYAERVCAAAGVDPKADYADVDGGRLWEAFTGFLARVDGPVEARLSEDNVTPFGGEGEPHPSFNDAIDEYFSARQTAQAGVAASSKVDERRAHLAEILRKQEEAFERAKTESVEAKAKGDLIYQRMGEINGVIAFVRESRKSKMGEEDILAGLEGYGIVKGLKGHVLTVDLL
jgi:predicted ribosome quality control (RQC) complex YloA/Tae2 family protein